MREVASLKLSTTSENNITLLNARSGLISKRKENIRTSTEENIRKAGGRGTRLASRRDLARVLCSLGAEYDRRPYGERKPSLFLASQRDHT